MCGITGFFHFDRDRVADAARLSRMTKSLQHRGPDGSGAHVSRNLALGHARLSIIDLGGGSQPMANEDGSIVITYNGEIYNYIELKAELVELGHSFRTASDTEVIIRAYEQWGTDCVNRLNGMWAFAIWDERAQQLFCSRDRLGEKPLYYAVYENTFVFGSEAKAVFEFGLPRRINSEILDVYLCMGYVPAPRSAFEGLSKLRAGEALTIRDGRLSLEKFWQAPLPGPAPVERERSEWLEEFEALLTDSVRIRLRSDVGFGAFLSGGLDSSSIVAIASQIAPDPVKTFTIGFAGTSRDERALADEVAVRFSTAHQEKAVGTTDIESSFRDIAWYFDEPFGDSSSLPTYLVSKAAERMTKVVLTGDGGDELLAGYNAHRSEKLADRLNSLPRLLWDSGLRSLLGATRAVVPGTRHKLALSRASRVLGAAALEFVDRLESKQIGLSRAERSTLLAGNQDIVSARDLLEDSLREPRASNLSNPEQLYYWLLTVSLPERMLTKVDRASMANSLETRVPFLDHRLIELLAVAPMDIKLPRWQAKSILRETVGRRLPASLLKAPKRGFDLPILEWITPDLRDWMARSIERCARSGALDGNALRGILARPDEILSARPNALWTLLALSQEI